MDQLLSAPASHHGERWAYKTVRGLPLKGTHGSQGLTVCIPREKETQQKAAEVLTASASPQAEQSRRLRSVATAASGRHRSRAELPGGQEVILGAGKAARSSGAKGITEK